MSHKILIRQARLKDVKIIWQIRNGRPIRRNSRNSEKIIFASHQAWFKDQYFTNRRNYCFIVEYKTQVAGYCRFDWSENNYTASLAVKPLFHGLGLGNILLNKSLKYLKTAKTILAEIKQENLASIKLFQKNGFEIFFQDKKFFYLKFNKSRNIFLRRTFALYYLLLKQPLKNSQAIVWLQGDRYDRGGKVAELYKQGWAAKIIVTGNNVLLGKNKRPEEINISLNKMIDWLISRGVSRQQVIIDDNSLNVKEQAINVIKIAKDQGWKSLILVASAYHQPRAFLTFLKQAEKLNWRGRIISAPAIISWHKIPSGRKKFAWQYFNEEIEKIKNYKKYATAPIKGIKYLSYVKA